MEKKVLEGLTEEQIAKAKQCKSQEELLALAAKEEVDLTDEQLKAVAGGCSDDNDKDKDDKDGGIRRIDR